jgi:DNA-binding NarL/FixJ family response regulator
MRQAHAAYLREGEVERAAGAGATLAAFLLNDGELAQANGWIARSRRLLDESGLDSVVAGYLATTSAVQMLMKGEVAAAAAGFAGAIETARRFGDPTLAAMGRLGTAQAFVALGRAAEALSLFDENMAAVAAGEVEPLFAGIVYCAVIDSCWRIYDLGRAREWTQALNAWCEAQPGLVEYRGSCLVHRAQILQLQGAWDEAAAEAERARRRLSTPHGQRGIGEAWYALAELHRLRGELAEAEAAFRSASDAGRPPQPGLALLRLAQGQVDAAARAIRRAKEEASPYDRLSVLPAFVEIMVAAGDLDAARAATTELESAGAAIGTPFLRALASHARGSVELAAGQDRPALGALRSAAAGWRELDMPYESARTRLAIARALKAEGDRDGAEVEFESARRAFARLGAKSDLASLPGAQETGAVRAGNLSPREAEVLRLLAAGRTNRAIAVDLHISEKTVARHVSNIFGKLDVSTRSAATAYAYQHGLSAGTT